MKCSLGGICVFENWKIHFCQKPKHKKTLYFLQNYVYTQLLAQNEAHIASKIFISQIRSPLDRRRGELHRIVCKRRKSPLPRWTTTLSKKIMEKNSAKRFSPSRLRVPRVTCCWFLTQYSIFRIYVFPGISAFCHEPRLAHSICFEFMFAGSSKMNRFHVFFVLTLD